MPGWYSNGGGKNLGYPLEFRTQLELGYAFENQSRVSLGYSHISNANLGETNHGTNMISLYYHIPAGWLFGQAPGEWGQTLDCASGRGEVACLRV